MHAMICLFIMDSFFFLLRSSLFTSYYPVYILVISLIQFIMFLVYGGAEPEKLSFAIISDFPQCNDIRVQFYRLGNGLFKLVDDRYSDASSQTIAERLQSSS